MVINQKRNPADGNGRRWAFLEKFIIPDIVEPEKDYLIRWRLVQTPWFGIFLHKILMIDNDVNMHDHPWNFISIVLRGGYTEDLHKFDKITDGVVRGHLEHNIWKAGSIHRMRIDPKRWQCDIHKITGLFRIPTWSLLFVGSRQRDWGYQTRNGWIARKDYDWHKYNGVHSN